MATLNQQYQDLFRQYQAEHPDQLEVRIEDVGRWALRKKLWDAPEHDKLAKFKEQMPRALREEHGTDAYGRHFRTKHAVPTVIQGKLAFTWGDIRTLPRERMVKALAHRRKNVEGDCYQMLVDAEQYNAVHPTQEPIQLSFDFTDDMQERQIADMRRKAS